MPTTKIQDEEDIILVEFAPMPGVRSVSFDAMDVIEKSKEAMEDAMKSIQGMARKTIKAIKEIPVVERPNTISVSFGLKLNAEGGAVVAKAGVEAAINVTMTWQHASAPAAKAKAKRK